MKKTLRIILIITCLSTTMSYAADNAGAFIEKGLSPKASAMGMSLTSIASHSDAVYWNPAGLANSEKTDIQILGTRAFETNFTSVQASHKWSRIGLGAALTQARVDDIKKTKESLIADRFEFTGEEVDYIATAYYLSAGFSVHPSLAVGATTKIIQEQADGFKATGIGMDIGAQLAIGDSITIGASVQNIVEPQMKWNTPSKNTDVIPTRVHIGVSHKWLEGNLVTALEMRLREHREATLHYGGEYHLNSFLSLRAGMDNTELGLGIGLNLSPIEINMAWSSPTVKEIDDIYRISLGYKF